jgi:Kef-type K+ transport system membrane component KefB
VVDDILALLVLAVVAGLAGGPFSTLGLVVLLTEVVIFLGAVVAFGPPVVRCLSGLAHTPLIPRSPLVFALLLTLGLAALSGTIGLASLIGAFLAGMIFEFSREEVATQIEPVYELLVPFFFAITGSRLDPTVFLDPGMLGLATVITLIAMVTKVVGGYLGAVGLAHPGRLAVGVGMMPRGEVVKGAFIRIEPLTWVVHNPVPIQVGPRTLRGVGTAGQSDPSGRGNPEHPPLNSQRAIPGL